MPRPNPVQNPLPKRPAPAPRPAGKPRPLVVPKLTKEQKAARRANPHAAAMATAGRGGLLLSTSRADFVGENRPRLAMPSKPQRVTPSRTADRSADLGAIRAELAKIIDAKVQQLLPGADDARKLTDAVELLTEELKFTNEAANARHVEQLDQFDQIAEALAGDAKAVEAIKAGIPARRAAAKKRNEG